MDRDLEELSAAEIAYVESRALIDANIPFEHVTGRNLRAGLADRYPVIYLLDADYSFYLPLGTLTATSAPSTGSLTRSRPINDAFNALVLTAGLPLFVEDFSATTDVFNRALPILGLVFVANLLPGLRLFGKAASIQFQLWSFHFLGVVLLWFATTRFDTHEGDGPEFFLLLVCARFDLKVVKTWVVRAPLPVEGLGVVDHLWPLDDLAFCRLGRALLLAVLLGRFLEGLQEIALRLGFEPLVAFC